MSDFEVSNVLNAANRQRGLEPTKELVAALNAVAALPADTHSAICFEVGEALTALSSPTGAGTLACWLGARVEQGAAPEPTLQPVLQTFLRWSRTIETAEDEDEEDPDPEQETLDGLQYLGQALVSHIAHADEQDRTSITKTRDVYNEFERVEHLSVGACWVLQLLRQHSGQLVVLDVENKKGVIARYENISNCFHLFTLLQGAVADPLNAERQSSELVQAIARGDEHGEVEDEAWWHYGQCHTPQSDIAAAIWGEMGPDCIDSIDGKQVILLWPPILQQRSWDSSFFQPILDQKRPNVELLRVLSEAEIQTWWEKIVLHNATAS